MAFGRLERTRGAEPMSDINMTPLVDVMLVLVVIFILTAPLLASAIRLDLPRAEGTAPAAAPRALTLVLDRQGQLFVDDQPVPSAAALARRLGEVAQAAPTPNCSCVLTLLCPMAGWWRSWARHMLPGCSASVL